MLLRAYPSRELNAVAGRPWYEPYYAYAGKYNWPVDSSERDLYPNRGDVSRILAATQGLDYSVDQAVSYLLSKGVARGKTSADLAGFGKEDLLTRAEAVQFIRNAVEGKLVLTGIALPKKYEAPVTNADAEFTVRGIGLGAAESAVVQLLGTPARRDLSEYGFEWLIYNSDYADYGQIGVSAEGKVVALYSNSSGWLTKSGIKVGSTSAAVRKAYGTPLTGIVKGNTRYVINSGGEYDVFLYGGGSYVTVFYDKHASGAVTAFQIVDRDTELKLEGFYGPASDRLREAFERQTLDLANAVRVRMGYKPFLWDEAISGTARKHSVDMAKRGFFDHDNPDGITPFQRMEADGLRYRLAGENIAAGQTSAIFAHEGWMNSLGHRKNVLGGFERLGIGVAFGGSMHVYYSQNFYTPR